MKRIGKFAISILMLICLGIVAPPSPSSQSTTIVQAAPLSQNGPTSGSIGDPGDIYLEYSITGIEITNEWSGGMFDAIHTGGPITFSGKMIVVVPEGFASFVRMNASLDGLEGVKFPEGEESSVKVFGETIERSFSFTFDIPPDYDVSFVSAGAVVEKCGGVCAIHSVSFDIDLPTPVPSSTPDPLATPEPSATPQKDVVITGQIYAPDPTGWRGGDRFPLVEVPVTLLQDGQVVARTISQQPDGTYQLPASTGTGYQLKVELLHGSTSPAAFQVVYDQDPNPVTVLSDLFDITSDSADVIERDLVFAPDSQLYSQGASLDAHLADLGGIYYHTRQAWEEAVLNLGLTMDLAPPLDVRAFDSHPDAVQAGSRCITPLTNDPGFGNSETYIDLSPDDSQFSKNLESSVIWHEFGHCLMADIQGDVYAFDPTNANHIGYANPTTTDSWGEGFATFYALLVQRDIEKKPRPIISMSGWRFNFEFPNYFPWTYSGNVSMEEYAVVSLIWDLVDGVENITQLEASNQRLSELAVSLDNPLAVEEEPRLYGDFVSISTKELFDLLTSDVSAIDQPAAASGFPHIFDVRQLYSVLAAVNVGAGASPYPGLTRLDELFIAHGFFDDINPHNLFYDPNEDIGYTGRRGMTIDGSVQISEITGRRYPPPVPNSYLGYRLEGSGYETIASQTQFEVTVSFPAPNDVYNYTFLTRSQGPGKLVVLAPDPAFPASIQVRVSDGDYQSDPLVIDSQDYWKAMRTASDGIFMEHTFQVEPVGDEGRLPFMDGLDNLTRLGVFALLSICCTGALAILIIALVARSRREKS